MKFIYAYALVLSLAQAAIVHHPELEVPTENVSQQPDGSGWIYLSNFTCACIIIFAVQVVICFGMLFFCNNRLYNVHRKKTT